MVGLEGHSLLAFGDVKNHQFGSLQPTTDDTQPAQFGSHSSAHERSIFNQCRLVSECDISRQCSSRPASDKLEAIRRAVEAKLILRPLNFVEEAARSKPSAVATPRIPGPEVQSRAGHMLIIPRYEKYIAEWWLPSCAG
ncbi:hypothetical protein EVAR_83146_1 [Eumeta japonica]|uniref:Uncharacterized protein n=1 Tax=Eumeta variegata TaxID=151549 RepID=A0A4C1Y9H0_EUMVA|nr:hypothetical protein EVAR_83146_1 [Eumeta japonica]